jgi:hypothetical protein
VSNIETREVLAGAYRGRGQMLTHAVVVDAEQIAVAVLW